MFLCKRNISFWVEDFIIWSMYFGYFVIILLRKRAWPYICINMNPLYARMLCANLVEFWPIVSGEKAFLDSSSQGECCGPSFKQTSIPLTQECFVLSLVEIWTVVPEKKIELEKLTDKRTDIRKTTLSFQFSNDKMRVPLNQACFLPCPYTFARVVWEKKIFKFSLFRYYIP